MALVKAYSNQTYDEYYIDTKTKNESFLKVAALLKAKGVENWHFPLKVYNKHVAKLDPYDKDLTKKEVLMIYEESTNNRYYFLRNVARIPVSGGKSGIGGGSEFILSRGNLALTWAFDLDISAYQIMPRQTGKTWGTLLNLLYDIHFHNNIEVIHFNKNQGDANDNLTRLKDASTMLPAWMQHSNEEFLTAKDKKGIKNNVQFFRNNVGSTFRTMASAGNEAKADAMARGKTAAKLWFDEIAFTFFNQAIYEAAKPAYDTAADSAKAHGMPYGIVLTTTPGDLSTEHGKYAYQYLLNCIPFKEEMYDFSGKKMNDILDNWAKDGHHRTLFMQFHYYQLGKTDEWYREKISQLGNITRARREYGLEWINTNGNSPFDEDDIILIKEMSEEIEKSAEIIKINKYYDLTVYEKYRGKKPVIISVDVAQGLGRDSSAIVVINPDTLKPIAVFKNNMVDSRKLRKIIVKIATHIFPNCILTVENNMVGKAVLEELDHTHIRHKIYREKITRSKDVMSGAFTKKKKYESMELGHNTNSQSRPKMMEILENIVRNQKHLVCIPEIYNEIRFFEVRNGRIDHCSGSHDDVTMAYLGGLYIIRYGTGLKGKGIYFNLEEDDDPEEVAAREEARKRMIATSRQIDMLRKPDKTPGEEWWDSISEERPVLTSWHIQQLQTQELIDMDCERNEIPDEDGFLKRKSTISKEVDSLILKSPLAKNNYNYLMGTSPQDEDDEENYGLAVNNMW